MSEQSFQERTEAPTPKRRDDARQEGRIPRSPEVTTAILLLASAGVISAGAGPVAEVLARSIQSIAALGAAPPETPDAASAMLRAFAGNVGAAVLPLLLAVTGTAAAVAGVQARGVLSTKPLAPKLERISPQSNLKRLVGMRAIADLLKSLLKLGLMSAVLYPIISGALSDAGELAMRSPMGLAAELKSRVVRLLLAAGAAYLVVALADYAYQIWEHEKSLKMSKEEVKREQKEQEGDMMIKARRRSMGRSRARQRMFQQVPEADVVVTNPTHIAVALRYRPEEFAAPVIVAMGQRKVAQRIKALAHSSGVPVMENKPLARALLAAGKVGESIPSNLYVAVAEVLAFVIKQRERQAAGAPGGRVWEVGE